MYEAHPVFDPNSGQKIGLLTTFSTNETTRVQCTLRAETDGYTGLARNTDYKGHAVYISRHEQTLIGYRIFTDKEQSPLARGVLKQIHYFIRVNEPNKNNLCIIKTGNHPSRSRYVRGDLTLEAKMLPPALLPEHMGITTNDHSKQAPALLSNTAGFPEFQLYPDQPLSQLSLTLGLFAISVQTKIHALRDQKTPNWLSPPITTGPLLPFPVDASSWINGSDEPLHRTCPDSYPHIAAYKEPSGKYRVSTESALFGFLISALEYMGDVFQQAVYQWNEQIKSSYRDIPQCEAHYETFHTTSMTLATQLRSGPKRQLTCFILDLIKPKGHIKTKVNELLQEITFLAGLIDLCEALIRKNHTHFHPHLITTFLALSAHTKEALSNNDTINPSALAMICTSLVCCDKALNPTTLMMALNQYKNLTRLNEQQTVISDRPLFLFLQYFYQQTDAKKLKRTLEKCNIFQHINQLDFWLPARELVFWPWPCNLLNTSRHVLDATAVNTHATHKLPPPHSKTQQYEGGLARHPKTMSLHASPT
jgi:hypothetical protein